MKVSLKKYLKTIIDSNDKHLREIMDLNEKFNAEIFRVFRETTDIHLLHLNNTYNQAKDTVSIIAAKTVSRDEHDGYKAMNERRINDLEATHIRDKGVNEITAKKEIKNEKLYYFIAGVLVSVIINYFLK